jgi:DGQHR domain-containing protein
MNLNSTIEVYGTEKVQGHEFVATMPAAQLMRITVDPRKTEDLALRADDIQLQNVFALRQQVQREFLNSAKARNVKPYADYICKLLDGMNGITPSIVLYTSAKLDFSRDNARLPVLHLPWSVQLVAIDGETQLAARHEAARMNPNTAEMQVDVKICYDRDLEWAKQAFHDLNLLSIRPNAATAVAMDMRDGLTHVTRKVANLPFYAKRIITGRQLKKKDNAITTLSILRASVVCFAEGIGGIQYGNKPVPLDSSRIELIERAAVEYYSAIANKYGPVMEDRLNTVIATPAVMAAMGALGHNLVNMGDEGDRKHELQRILSELDPVDWTRGPHWDGICGKVRPDGTFSTAGGVKDSGGASYKALADVTSEYYKRVRGLNSLAAA